MNDQALERQAAALADDRLERVQPGQQPRLHVGHAGPVGDRRPRSGTGARPPSPDRTPCPCARSAGRAARPAGPRTWRRPCRRAARRDRVAISTVGAQLGRGSAPIQRPTSLTPVGRVAAAVDVDEVLEVGEVGRQVGARSRRAARRARRSTGVGGVSVEAVMDGQSSGAGALAILPGPCDWSRSACSRDRTSTGSSRWSSWRSPSAGGGPGTASAIPGGTRWSGSAPTCRPATGPTRSPRPSPGSAGCGPTTARAAAGSPSIARPIPGHWIVTFPWVGAERART